MGERGRLSASEDIDVAIGHPHGRHHPGVVGDLAVVGDGGERQLLMPRHPDLADHQHVERRTQRSRHLGGHRYAATGEPEHHRVLAGEVGQPLGKPAAGVDPIREHYGHTQSFFTRRPSSTRSKPRPPERSAAVWIQRCGRWVRAVGFEPTLSGF